MSICKAFLLAALLSIHAAAQSPAAQVQTANVAAGAFSFLPDRVITAGAGFLSPNSKFAYGSFSKYLGQATYSTTAIEYSIVGKQVITSTLTGLTKPLFQYGPITLLLTGLGGVTSTGAAIGSAQGAIDIRLGTSTGHSSSGPDNPWGIVISAQKETAGGFKITGGIRWAK